MESNISTFVHSCKVNTSSALLWGLWGLELNIVDESKIIALLFELKRDELIKVSVIEKINKIVIIIPPKNPTFLILTRSKSK